VVVKFCASVEAPVTVATAAMACRPTMPLMARLVWLTSWPAKSSGFRGVSFEEGLLWEIEGFGFYSPVLSWMPGVNENWIRYCANWLSLG